ncbi:MAG: hypothetical protein Ct9H300mP14_10960 [Gammaproteobacteria bacterium]|nr:MAG: hypothetical protein Ct9H300mP14_10960 [Gammaproteobacteria bacterium]
MPGPKFKGNATLFLHCQPESSIRGRNGDTKQPESTHLFHENIRYPVFPGNFGLVGETVPGPQTCGWFGEADRVCLDLESLLVSPKTKVPIGHVLAQFGPPQKYAMASPFAPVPFRRRQSFSGQSGHFSAILFSWGGLLHTTSCLNIFTGRVR